MCKINVIDVFFCIWSLILNSAFLFINDNLKKLEFIFNFDLDQSLVLWIQTLQKITGIILLCVGVLFEVMIINNKNWKKILISYLILPTSLGLFYNLELKNFEIFEWGLFDTMLFIFKWNVYILVFIVFLSFFLFIVCIYLFYKMQNMRNFINFVVGFLQIFMMITYFLIPCLCGILYMLQIFLEKDLFFMPIIYFVKTIILIIILIKKKKKSDLLISPSEV
jgi:hypothetical protein